MRLKIVFNPFARRWRARRQVERMHACLHAARLEYEFAETRAPGDAERETFAAASGDFDAIVAAGGDGTVNEVINGLITAAGEAVTRPLAVLPLGTGNDFADLAGLPGDLRQAVDVIAAGRTRQIDVGRVTYWTEQSAGDPAVRYFGNNCAVAMEPLVTIENTRIRSLSGNLRYVVSLLRALRKLKAWQMRVSWDDGGHKGPVHLLSICNGRRCGGVFRMAPEACPDDGLFDLVLVPELPMFEVLKLLPRFFRGSHVRQPRVRCVRTRRVSIESVPGTPIHADGEVLTESATRIDYEILPAKLTLLTP